MLNVNRPFFEALLEEHSISKRELGRRLKLSASQMHRTLEGTRKMQIGEAVEIARILGVTLQDVCVNAGISGARQEMLHVPVIGAMSELGTIEAIPEGTAEHTTSPGSMLSAVVAIQARTGGNALEWADGWVFFCQQEEASPDPSMFGRFCRVKITNGPEVMATLRRGYKTNTFNLTGFYKAESQQIDWVQPVLVTRHP